MVSLEEMRERIARLRARPPSGDIEARATALARAAARFLDRDDPLRSKALDALPATTGFSREMIDEALAWIFSPLADREAIVRTARHAAAPFPLVGIVSAGNVPGVALPKAVLALAAGAAVVVKAASAEPILTPLFAEALDGVSPALAAALAVVHWPGGAGDAEDELLSAVDSLVVYGSDETVSAITARRPRGVTAYGHKLSVGVVRLDRGGDTRELAEAAANDVALYDQLGCLSPQTLYTIGDTTASRRRFVDDLARVLVEAERRWPPGEVDEPAALAIRRLRDEYEWRELCGDRVSMRAGASAASFTVIDDPTSGLRGSPLHRTVFVRRLEAVDELPRAVGEWLPRIECVGVAPWPDADSARSLGALGIPRIAPLGEMQRPDLEWRQGDLEPMAGIVAGGER
jgi:Acyl-CoA reductase (LuxC)